MDVFQSMRFFIAVAQSGSFTAAAEMPDTNTTNVSKAISALEARLHTRLINRTTRRLAVTEAGVRYLERCPPMWPNAVCRKHRASFANTSVCASSTR